MWYTLCLLNEFLILDETIVITPNQTDGLQIWKYSV
jgi:hypothetical protein